MPSAEMTLDDLINGQQSSPSPVEPSTVVGEPDSGPSGGVFGRLLEWLQTPSLETPLEAYATHPLHDGRAGTSRLLRGGEALLGNTRLAVIDLLLGLIERIQARRQEVSADAPRVDHGREWVGQDDVQR